MTRKHFQAIANIIRARLGYNASTIDYDEGYNMAVENIADDLAHYFAEENVRFDRDKFLTACGLRGKVKP